MAKHILIPMHPIRKYNMRDFLSTFNIIYYHKVLTLSVSENITFKNIITGIKGSSVIIYTKNEYQQETQCWEYTH
jgi:hypothetical protein